VGLFTHNRWLEFYRSHFGALTMPAWLQQTLSILGIFLTFNFVALGWVWFALLYPLKAGRLCSSSLVVSPHA